jgi:hypothetical protein
MKSGEQNGENTWSEWIDFDQTSITKADIPNLPGVFKVHASMKITIFVRIAIRTLYRQGEKI